MTGKRICLPVAADPTNLHHLQIKASLSFHLEMHALNDDLNRDWTL